VWLFSPGIPLLRRNERDKNWHRAPHWPPLSHDVHAPPNTRLTPPSSSPILIFFLSSVLVVSRRPPRHRCTVARLHRFLSLASSTTMVSSTSSSPDHPSPPWPGQQRARRGGGTRGHGEAAGERQDGGEILEVDDLLARRAVSALPFPCPLLDMAALDRGPAAIR
jgi:hypothetical protein